MSRFEIAGGHRPPLQSKDMPITPYLYYTDVGSALKFLSRAFGFRKFGQTMKGPDGKLNHAAVKLGNDLIMMGRPGPKYKNPKRLGQTTQSSLYQYQECRQTLRTREEGRSKDSRET